LIVSISEKQTYTIKKLEDEYICANWDNNLADMHLKLRPSEQNIQ